LGVALATLCLRLASVGRPAAQQDNDEGAVETGTEILTESAPDLKRAATFGAKAAAGEAAHASRSAPVLGFGEPRRSWRLLTSISIAGPSISPALGARRPVHDDHEISCGTRGERFSFRSVDYCMRVRNHLAAHGIAVSGAVPQPNFGATGNRAPSRALSGSRAVSFTALSTRLRALTDRMSSRR
jgi:hypothetical protein